MPKIEFDEWHIAEIVSDLCVAADTIKGSGDAWVRIFRAIKALQEAGVRLPEDKP